ncbi:MAG: polysaccharide pyruvyl transferase family protein [candidate division WOR-3 bacterium]
MKFFLYGYYTRSNFGDFLIARALLKLLEVYVPSAHIYIYWRDSLVPPSLRGNPRVHVIKRPENFKNLLTLLKVLLCVDVVIVGGGQKYRWSMKSGLAPQLIIPCLSKILGKRLLFLSVGVEPVRDLLWAGLVKESFNAADGASVRDLISFHYLKSIGVGCVLSSDLVFYYIMNYYGQLNSLKRRCSRMKHGVVKNVGLAIRCSEIAYDLLTRYFPDLIAKLARNYTVTLLPATLGDLAIYRRILNQMPPSIKQRVVIEENLDHVHIIKVLAKLDVILSTRLHFLLFALALDIPIIGINYPVKVHALCRELGPVCDVRDTDRIFNAVAFASCCPLKYNKFLRKNFDKVLRNIKLLRIVTSKRSRNIFASLSIRLRLIPWFLFICILKFVNFPKLYRDLKLPP